MSSSRLPRALGAPSLLALAGLLALAVLAPSAAQATLWTAPGISRPLASATLEQCLVAGPQSERSATFAGEMTGVGANARMEMRIDVAERMPEAAEYHTVTAPGLGVWRVAAPGVKAYRYLKQVTNLAGPAYYRGVVRFRWLSPHGHLLALATLHTRRCEEPTTSIVTEPRLQGAEAPAQAGQGSLESR